jgi:hypothetical protein
VTADDPKCAHGVSQKTYCDTCLAERPGGPCKRCGGQTLDCGVDDLCPKCDPVDQPCKCGKQMLRSWWTSITDAGNEGTDYVKHTREECLTRTERVLAKNGSTCGYCGTALSRPTTFASIALEMDGETAHDVDRCRKVLVVQRDTMTKTLTIVQTRCTELLEETRRLRNG